MSPPVRLKIDSLAVGGDGVGREQNGRAVFVPDTVPGDIVDVAILQQKRRFARAELLAVVEPSPFRQEPICPEVGRGCGGCGLAHVSPAGQATLKRRMVLDTLVRLAKLADPLVVAAPPLAPTGFRTTIRVGVQGGRAAFRRARSHDLLTVSTCRVAHPGLVELIERGRFANASEATLRMGAATGQRLALVDPTAQGVTLPADVVVVGAEDTERLASAHYQDIVAGRTWRISARSFFQTRADGAEQLVASVAAALGRGGLAKPATLLDAYGGVGLLSAAAPLADVVSVEASASASADAAVNLADRDALVVCAPLERWRPVQVQAVVADPARAGLGEPAVAILAGCGADVFVLVSCDAASLGRDAALLASHGYRHVRSEVLDLFPDTPHVEVVTLFVRG